MISLSSTGTLRTGKSQIDLSETQVAWLLTESLAFHMGTFSATYISMKSEKTMIHALKCDFDLRILASGLSVSRNCTSCFIKMI